MMFHPTMPHTLKKIHIHHNSKTIKMYVDKITLDRDFVLSRPFPSRRRNWKEYYRISGTEFYITLQEWQVILDSTEDRIDLHVKNEPLYEGNEDTFIHTLRPVPWYWIL